MYPLLEGSLIWRPPGLLRVDMGEGEGEGEGEGAVLWGSVPLCPLAGLPPAMLLSTRVPMLPSLESSTLSCPSPGEHRRGERFSRPSTSFLPAVPLPVPGIPLTARMGPEWCGGCAAALAQKVFRLWTAWTLSSSTVLRRRSRSGASTWLDVDPVEE